MPRSKKYLDAELISRLRGLGLRARGVVAGSVSGLHRSAYHGFSVEFAEHRQYVPGDDLRYVDWRVFGRNDRLYIKEYEEETNLRCNILLDTSASMAYRGAAAARQYSKFEVACVLAASLSHLLTSQQDAVGLIAFDSQVRTRLPPATGKAQLNSIEQVLEQCSPQRPTEVKLLFHGLAEELRERSMVILISDLLADPQDVVSGIEHIGYARHELVVFHVLDDDEWNLPFIENVEFVGLEDSLRLLTDPQALRASYRAALARFVARVQAACRRHHADYVPVNTRDPLDVVLCGYLARRAGRLGGAARR